MKNPVLAISTAVLFLANPAQSFGSPDKRTEFEGYYHFCGLEPPTGVWETPGGTVHIRDALNIIYWETGNPYIDGPATSVPNINIGPNGTIVVLDATLDPEAYTGTWEIQEVVRIPSDGGASMGGGVGHGTGELRGMTMEFTGGDMVFGVNNCPGGSDNPSVPVQGTILTP